MNRLALIACLALVGCPKAETPEPASHSLPPVTEVASAPVEPALPLTAIEASPPVAPMVEPGIEVELADPAPVGAPKMRFDFKGETPGEMTLASFHAKYPEATKFSLETRPGVETWIVRGGLTIANQDVATGAYTFLDGSLAMIRLGISGDAFRVRDALREKYGKPDMDHETDLKWRSSDSAIRLSLTSPPDVVIEDITTMQAIRDRLKAEKDKASKQSAKDL